MNDLLVFENNVGMSENQLHVRTSKTGQGLFKLTTLNNRLVQLASFNNVSVVV